MFASSGEAETSSNPRSSFSLSQFSHDNDIGKSYDQSLATDADASYQKEYQPERRVSNDYSGSEKDHTLEPEHKSRSADPILRPSSVAGETTIFQGILSQIGRPDHEGWMRKKGGLYNTWKNRYIVLKGLHLYWIRSDSVFVSIALAGWCVWHLILSDITGDQGRRACQYHRLSHHPR